MASKLKKAIRAVKDQTSIGLAKVSISNASSNLEVAILKATTHDEVPIDDKYVYEVVQIVSSNKVYAAACARAIGKRIGRTRNWIVATKSLMLILRIFQDGDPYFPREVLHVMKRGSKILNLSSFRDDSWDFTAFVRTFALYLDERLECFLTGKLQHRYDRVMGSNEPGRDIKPAMLIDKISYWQRLLERAIATRPTGPAKMNLLVQICVYAIVQESFEVYKDISDGVTLVIDSFFHLHYQNCVSAFQMCVKAANQFKELSDFYSSCKSLGIGRTSEYPSVQTISDELIGTLQEFLKAQSSFQSRSPKPTKRFSRLPAPSLSKVESKSPGRTSDSYGRQSQPVSGQSSEMGSPQSTSLQDLINATETGMTGPAISIDLEAYSPQQRDYTFGMRHMCHSSRSLPVSMSMTDVMSLADWSQQDDEMEPQKQDQNQKEFTDSSLVSDNWELVLAATVSSSSAAAASPKLLSDNNTNFNAYTENTTMAKEKHPATTDNSSNGWDLVLFNAAPPQPPINHYNPFLQDPIELTNAQPFTSSIPTFQAILPTFSMQNAHHQTSFNAIQIENDPFYDDDAFSAGRQNLLHEQELWLQNQNKIIAKVNMA
ncbi:hypothetical protein BUALT_Bualt18G0009700 [Buddleja alternifolia]|uniref:ENTH domain-containing protein n=1 Tax=Buddleja alternifolia TaxID=168488 RepID=A0AAV6W2W2_9LAMI|nr:hypothetical protein BUALT_Bualt18G0009700 [Buddleja alternifolia]